MSVFKLQEWWSTQVGAGEEFDSGSLVIGNVDNNASNPSDKVVVGSLQGFLRVFHPTKPYFSPGDLLIEEDLGLPVLQLLQGLFLPMSLNLGLAVLHPRKLCVYELVFVQNSTDSNDGYHVLEKSYEHELGIDGQHFTAFNMTSGPFGGVHGREMIMVQSMDGKLQIFEQTANAFTRQFVDCLFPGPLKYLPRLDAFVTVSTACEAQCFKYQVIANSQGELRGSNSTSASKDDSTTTGAFGLNAMRSALMEWSVIVGESCQSIAEGSFSGAKFNNGQLSSGELLLLCEKSLFLVKESGGVLQQRRLERTPSCMCSYPCGENDTDNFLLAHHDGTIQVYSKFNLVWAAKAEKTPVNIQVASFGDQQGLVVTLDDTGRLDISFLGTKPPLTIATSSLSRELDYDKVDEEHRSLLQIIRDHKTSSKAESKDKLILRSQVPKQLDLDPVGPGVELPKNLVAFPETFQAAGAQGLVKICVRLYVAYSGTDVASNVSIIVSTPSFVHVVPKNYIVKTVKPNSTPLMIKLYMYARPDQFASSLEADVTATYKSTTGEPRIVNHKIDIPLFLACTIRPPVKLAAFKFTLDTGLPAVSLKDLFEDVVKAQEEALQSDVNIGGSETQAIAFQLWAADRNDEGRGGVPPPAIVSILVSKLGGRYRVQSDSLPALYLISSELEKRLRTRLSLSLPDDSSLSIKFDDEMPLDAYFEEITAHFDNRKDLQKYYSELNDKAHLFRVVQKRLLTRFKDRNASALGGLDTIMKETYEHLLKLSDTAQSTQANLSRQQYDLACISKLLVQLAALKSNIPDEERYLLESYLCPDLPHGTGGCSDGLDGSGWEETVESALTYLLKTALSKTPKATTKVNTAPVEMLENVNTLKQRLSLVFTKLSEGKSIIPPED